MLPNKVKKENGKGKLVRWDPITVRLEEKKLIT